MFVFEIFLPVVDTHGDYFPPEIFREAFDDLADKFGFIETRTVYRPLRLDGAAIQELELCRYRFDLPSTEDNQRWLVAWRTEQERRFQESLWMIRYRRA